MRLQNSTPVKRSIQEKNITQSEPIAKEELYKSGMTAAEITNEFNQSLRSPIVITKSNYVRPVSVPKKASHHSSTRSTGRRSSFRKGGGGGSGNGNGNGNGNGTGSKGGGLRNGDFPDMGDRRPSMGTITSQASHRKGDTVKEEEIKLKIRRCSERKSLCFNKCL